MARLAWAFCLSLVVLLVGPAVGPAVAQQPACGQVVTHDVRLAQDLRCPETDGLVVGAPGITIDLNGHAIDQGLGFRGGGIAVDNSGGYDGVTVKNGSLGADGDGVRLVGASGNRLVDLSASGGAEAVYIEGGSANRVVRGSFTGFAGIRVRGSDSVRITGVRVQSQPADGISLAGSWGVIAGNTTAARIDVGGNGNRVSDNVVVGALDAGIAILSGSGNVVLRNWAVDTQPVFAGDDSTGDGIHVGAFTADTVVRENIAVRNGDDGIDLESSGARVVRNLANDNADLGIDARPGTTAVGNIAHGNGNPAQCAGISCG